MPDHQDVEWGDGYGLLGNVNVLGPLEELDGGCPAEVLPGFAGFYHIRFTLKFDGAPEANNRVDEFEMGEQLGYVGKTEGCLRGLRVALRFGDRGCVVGTLDGTCGNVVDCRGHC